MELSISLDVQSITASMEEHYIMVVGLVVIMLALYLNNRPISHLPLPPGPKGLPLIGNLLDMPKNMEWKTYHKWAKEFNSDIISINIAGTTIMILDSLEAANELLERRSSKYSSRPKMPMLVDLMGYDYILPTMEYGARWRQNRRLVQQALSPNALENFRPALLKSCWNLLNRLLDNPDDIMGNLRHMTAESIISVAYGLDVQPTNDPYIQLLEEGIEGPAAANVPGAFLVDIFPWLKHVPAWMPGAGFKRKAKEWKRMGRAMVEGPFEATKENTRNGISRPSFTSLALQHLEGGTHDLAYTEENIKNAAATLYIVGVDTTLAVLGSCVLALLHHPEIVQRAQEELASLLNGDSESRSTSDSDSSSAAIRLPQFEDEPALPYIGAIVKEAFRWNDVSPLGVAHVVTDDDEYKGYLIPAGTILIANSWAMLHDEKAYPDPFAFNPERFMKDGKLDASVQDPTVSCFGFGRRICPGRHMAYSSAWITIASLLTMFDVKKKVDKDDGTVIDPGYEYMPTSMYTPKPFVGSITPRSKECEDLIRAVASQDVMP